MITRTATCSSAAQFDTVSAPGERQVIHIDHARTVAWCGQTGIHRKVGVKDTFTQQRAAADHDRSKYVAVGTIYVNRRPGLDIQGRTDGNAVADAQVPGAAVDR